MYFLNHTFDIAMLLIIWVVQLVIYPYFRTIGSKNFQAHHARYTRAMLFIVGPLMILQLAFALYFVLTVKAPTESYHLKLALVVFTWISTFLISVPYHNKLSSQGKDSQTITDLISTNWIRTFLWTSIVVL